MLNRCQPGFLLPISYKYVQRHGEGGRRAAGEGGTLFKSRPGPAYGKEGGEKETRRGLQSAWQEAAFHPTPCDWGLLQVLQKAGVKAVGAPENPSLPAYGARGAASPSNRLAVSSDPRKGSCVAEMPWHRWKASSPGAPVTQPRARGLGPRPGELPHPPQAGRGQALTQVVLLHSPSFLPAGRPVATPQPPSPLGAWLGSGFSSAGSSAG